MKRALTFAVAMALGSVLTVAVVSAQAKPEKGIVIGDVVELSTYALKGVGEDLVEAHKERINEGFPVGILEEETGKIWIAVYRDPAPASHLEKANEHVVDYVGKKVVVQGLKYEPKGANVIRIGVISEY